MVPHGLDRNQQKSVLAGLQPEGHSMHASAVLCLCTTRQTQANCRKSCVMKSCNDDHDQYASEATPYFCCSFTVQATASQITLATNGAKLHIDTKRSGYAHACTEVPHNWGNLANSLSNQCALHGQQTSMYGNHATSQVVPWVRCQ